jgi:putative flippase GtrA
MVRRMLERVFNCHPVQTRVRVLVSHSLPRFAASGVLITIVSLGITATVLAAGGGRPVAVSFGYLISSLLGYFLHSLVSFRQSLAGQLAPLRSYLGLLIVSALMAYVGSGIFDFLFHGRLIALFLAIAFPVVVNYLLWRLLLARSR